MGGLDVVSKRVLVLGALAWLVGSLLWLLATPPLGHDEAQYALAFSDVWAGRELRWVYLSRGMHAVAGPGMLLGGGELALRVVPLLWGAALLAVTGRLAYQVFGGATAAWTVALLATSSPIVRRAAELLSDVPSTALLLAGTSVVVRELVRSGDGDGARASWRLLWAAPLWAAAFYIRYASCVPAALIGGAAAVAGWRAVRARPAPVVATAGLLAILLIPHVLDSMQLLGSPLGILLESQSVPVAAVSGLTTYLTANPLAFYGWALAPVLPIGVLSIAWYGARAWRGRQERSEASLAARRAAVLWIAAIASVVVIGLTAVGQVRYILFGVALLTMLAVELVRAAAQRLPAAARRALGGALLAALVGMLAWSVIAVERHGRSRRKAMQPTMDTIAVMRADAAGRKCHFLAAQYTQIEWYTGCNGHSFSVEEAHARGEVVYFVSNDGWQPSEQERALPHQVIFETAKTNLQVLRLTNPSTKGGR